VIAIKMTDKEMKELDELVEYLKAAGIAEFDLERGDQKIRIKFAGTAGAAVDSAALNKLLAQAATSGSSASAAQPAAKSAAQEQTSAGEAADAGLHEVKSPIVGTFYESPSPGSPAFVKPGDQVQAGQVLCIVEAMKLMNEIEADISGEVVKRIANNGQPVEFGQPLYLIRPS
jgi:acetyl-CoA carboxylase biotin carboxyl carrier protein